MLSSGQAPQMPADHTKHPQGRPLLDPGALSALWLEEGDGVAVLEHGSPIALIPGWSDMSTGMPGYARDIIGQTPFGWSLDQAMEGLGPRIAEAQRFWSWRSDAGHLGVLPAGGASATCSAGSAPAASTGTSAAAGRRWSACPSGRRPRSAPTPCCPRSG